VLLQLLGTKDERKTTCETLIAPGRFNVVVTSYECVLKEKATLTKINWKYLMIDEAHRIKVSCLRPGACCCDVQCHAVKLVSLPCVLVVSAC
jgi:SNF2-related domain